MTEVISSSDTESLVRLNNNTDTGNECDQVNSVTFIKLWNIIAPWSENISAKNWKIFKQKWENILAKIVKIIKVDIFCETLVKF